MNIDVPTFFLAIIIVSATLSASIGLSTSRDQKEGIRFWTGAFAAFGLGYLLFLLRPIVGATASIIIGNSLIVASFSLFTEGLCQFHGRRPNRLIVWTPVAVILVTYPFLLDKLHWRVVLSSTVAASQCLMIILALLQDQGRTPGRGRYLFGSGLATGVMVFVSRIIGTLTGLQGPKAFLASDRIETATFLVTMICLILLSHGLLVMIKERADERIRELATHDPLTGLANRRLLDETLLDEWARASRSGLPLALVMVDVDWFKKFNDLYGHQAGDRCLAAVAGILLSTARRAGDLAARYGGEEFLLVLPNTSALAAETLARQICRLVEALNIAHVQSSAHRLTVSAGVAALEGRGYKDVDDLLGAVDTALYRAKEGGRNQVQVAPRPVAPTAARGQAHGA